MLGHKVWQRFRERFDAWVTVRGSSQGAAGGLLDGDRVITDVRVEDPDGLIRAFEMARPSVVVNCVGIVKQRKSAADPLPSIAINSLYPHRAAALARATGARMIHISTDCVFAGTRGGYTEDDAPDATDLYGRTKLLGEIAGPGLLTLRTSIIGREIASTTGLAEWFLAQRGRRAKGYTRALFSGVTTGTLAGILAELIERHPSLEGIYHLAADPISKYDVLCKLNHAYGAGIAIDATDEVAIDRTLNGSRFTRDTGLRPPGWDDMIADMASDSTPYDEWRRSRV